MTHHKDIDALVNDLVMSDDMAVKQAAAAEILAMAKAKGIYLASIHNLYKACGERKCPGFTVPAINLRCLTYYLARAIFRVAKKNNAGAFIFEIAKSEMGYTDQKPVEYTGVVLAAAVKEGYTGPVFIQGDHFQAKAKSFVADPKKELDALRQIINDAVAGGF